MLVGVVVCVDDVAVAVVDDARVVIHINDVVDVTMYNETRLCGVHALRSVA